MTYIDDAPVYQHNNKKLGKPIEYRSFKWKIIQPSIDTMTRIFGLPFLRSRRKLSLWLKKHFKTNTGQEAGGKRS